MRRIILPFEDLFVVVEINLLGLHWKQNIDVAAAVSYDCDLPDSSHAFPEVSEDRDEHSKILVHFALGEGHVQFNFAAFSWRSLIVELVAWYFRPIDPL